MDHANHGITQLVDRMLMVIDLGRHVVNGTRWQCGCDDPVHEKLLER